MEPRERRPIVGRPTEADVIWEVAASRNLILDAIYELGEQIAMIDKEITDDVQAIMDEISTVASDFDAAMARNTHADIVAALQPVRDRLAALDAKTKSAMASAPATPAPEPAPTPTPTDTTTVPPAGSPSPVI